MDTFFTVVGIILLICIGPILLGLVLLCCGFGEGGVLAGSWAAGMQSVIGNVAAGSWFAISQSMMATGLLCNLVGLAIVVAVVTISFSTYYICCYEGAYSPANITLSIEPSFNDGADSIADTYGYINASASNANITESIANTFEDVKNSITDANITAKIGETYEDVKGTIPNANIPSKFADTYEYIKTSVSKANLTKSIANTFKAKMVETYGDAKEIISNANIPTKFANTFEDMKNPVSTANLKSSISEAFASVEDSISKADIQSSNGDSFNQLFSSACSKISHGNLSLQIFSIILIKHFFIN